MDINQISFTISGSAGGASKSLEVLLRRVTALETAFIKFSASAEGAVTALGRIQGAVVGVSGATGAVKLPTTALKKMGTVTETAGKQLKTFNTHVKSSGTGLGTLIKRLTQVAFVVYTVKRAVGILNSGIQNSISYIENYNLFVVAMGKNAQRAEAFVSTFASSMYLDSAEVTRTMGLFYQISSSLGLTSDKAYTLSENFTKLAGDLSSFYNISVEDAVTKLQAGLVGETEPLRRLGIVITENNLAETARRFGITKSIRMMTEQEKIQLRYISALLQTKNAQGDLARTLETPANMIRVMKEQFTVFTRELGNIFIPTMQRMLPYFIAFTKAMAQFTAVIANSMGFKRPEIADIATPEDADNLANASDAVDDLTDSIKKLDKSTTGIDELNILGDTDTDAIGDAIDVAMSDYDNQMNLVAGTFDGLVARFRSALDVVSGALDGVFSETSTAFTGLLKFLFPDTMTTLGFAMGLRSLFKTIDNIIAGIVEGFTKFLAMGKELWDTVLKPIISAVFPDLAEFMETGKLVDVIAELVRVMLTLKSVNFVAGLARQVGTLGVGIAALGTLGVGTAALGAFFSVGASRKATVAQQARQIDTTDPALQDYLNLEMFRLKHESGVKKPLGGENQIIAYAKSYAGGDEKLGLPDLSQGYERDMKANATSARDAILEAFKKASSSENSTIPKVLKDLLDSTDGVVAFAKKANELNVNELTYQSIVKVADILSREASIRKSLDYTFTKAIENGGLREKDLTYYDKILASLVDTPQQWNTSDELIAIIKTLITTIEIANRRGRESTGSNRAVGTTFTGVSIGQYANGGLPPKGDLFIAGEAGPELVTSFGGESIVLNEKQLGGIPRFADGTGGGSFTDPLSMFFKNIFAGVKDGVEGLSKGIKSTVDWFGKFDKANKDMLGKFSKVGTDVKTWFDGTKEKIQGGFKVVTDWLAKGAIGQISTWVSKASKWIGDGATKVVNTISGISANIGKALGSYWKTFVDNPVAFGVKTGADGKPSESQKTMAKGGIDTLMDSMGLGSIMTIVDALIGGAEGQIGQFLSNLPSFVSAGMAVIKDLITGVAEALPAIVGMLPEVITSIIDALTDPETINAILSAVPVIISALVGAIPLVIDAILELFSGENLKMFANLGWQIGLALVVGLTNVIIEGVNGISKVLNKLLGWTGLNIPMIPRIPMPEVKTFASGGYPAEGQMFIANEAGPEMIGSIGGRTAVANNDQIVQAVSDGVYRAVVQAFGQQKDKPVMVYLDGEKIYDSNQKIARTRGLAFGMEGF